MGLLPILAEDLGLGAQAVQTGTMLGVLAMILLWVRKFLDERASKDAELRMLERDLAQKHREIETSQWKSSIERLSETNERLCEVHERLVESADAFQTHTIKAVESAALAADANARASATTRDALAEAGTLARELRPILDRLQKGTVT